MSRSVRLKDHWAEQRLFGRRVLAATTVILVCLGALFSRLVYLQVVKHDYFSDLSQGNRIRIDPVPPSRGLIFDRNGVPLALNRPAYQLEVTRELTPDLPDTLHRLVGLGLMPAEDYERTLRTIKARRSFESVPVRLQLSEEELARFAVNRPDFPGVEVRPRLTRYYPLGGTGVHALGYVAAISEQDQERIDTANYAGTTLIGKLGIERAYEEDLHGETGYQQLLVNAQGRRVERVGLTAPDLERREPMAGKDLYLAVDARVQKAAEDALAGRRAAVVAIDPRNGDVLAFVSTPTFDPNGFARGLTYAEYAALSENMDVPLFDRALRGEYPPGSTIKPLVALAALEDGVVDADTTKLCRGAFQLPGSSHRFRDWKKGGHGTVNMHSAIAQSCDVYFYGVADRMGIDRLHEFPCTVRPRGCDRHRHRRRAQGTGALAGVEEEGLQAQGPADLVPGRDGDHRHRPGLHARHAAAACACRRDRLHARQALCAAPRDGDARFGDRRDQQAPAGRTAVREGEQARVLGCDHRRHDRRDERPDRNG